MQQSWWQTFRNTLSNTSFDPELCKDHFCGTLMTAEPVCPPVLVVVDIHTQTLQLIENGQMVECYRVSTSKHGIGCRENTGCTPLGWHKVAQKIGAGMDPGTVFRGRQGAGFTEDLQADHSIDLITTRILWLSGIQEGFNQGGQVDSKNRYIYIHGTAQEHLLGHPVSEGCVRMANADVVALYDRVAEGTPVFIREAAVAIHAPNGDNSTAPI